MYILSVLLHLTRDIFGTDGLLDDEKSDHVVLVDYRRECDPSFCRATADASNEHQDKI